MTWQKAKRWLIIHGTIAAAVLIFSFVIAVVEVAWVLRVVSTTVISYLGGKLTSWIDRQEL